MEQKAPYDDYVMDHIRNARNYRALESADRALTVSNPMCGDELTLQVRIAGGAVEDIAFQCQCCGISMASASMMTEWAKGRTLERAARQAQEIATRLADRHDLADADAGMERALGTITRDFPSRARCAAFPWKALQAILQER